MLWAMLIPLVAADGPADGTTTTSWLEEPGEMRQACKSLEPHAE